MMALKSMLFGRLFIRFRCSPKNGRSYCSRNILILKERGMLADLFPDTSANEIYDLCIKSPQTVYAGFDPTADSLHVGNLLVLLNLFHWQRGGHRVIILLGGATARIGDPSGKSKERKEMYEVEIERNCQEIETILKNIISNHEEIYNKRSNSPKKLTPIKIVNNASWYEKMNVLQFIGNVGRHFRVGTMLGRESVRSRMNSDSGISFTEFSYQILQAYDWLHLFDKYNCRFQIGGNDQLGNIVSGFDLISRIHDQRVYGLTVPLVTNEEGDKYGKSSGNVIWLSRGKTTPFQLYQFFIRANDSEIQKLLMLFTFESLPNIENIMSAHQKHPEKRLAQKIAAEHVTELVHGEQGLRQAKKITSVLYDKTVPLHELDSSDLTAVFEGANVVEQLLKPGVTILEAAMNAQCFKTESDALRIISAGGFFVNQERVVNYNEVLTPACHILPSNITVLRVGKKNYTIVKWL